MRELSEAEIHQFLDSKEQWMVLTTLGPDGFPHSVPLGYFRFGSDLVSGCKPFTQKVKNIERNPKVSALFENGRGGQGLKGVLFRGRARIVRDQEEKWELKREACRQRGEEPPHELNPDFVYIRITPQKITSWARP